MLFLPQQLTILIRYSPGNEIVLLILRLHRTLVAASLLFYGFGNANRVGNKKSLLKLFSPAIVKSYEHEAEDSKAFCNLVWLEPNSI